MSEIQTVLVPVLRAGDRLRNKRHPSLYAVFQRYHAHQAGWAVLLREDGIQDIGPLANWERVGAAELKPLPWEEGL